MKPELKHRRKSCAGFVILLAAGLFLPVVHAKGTAYETVKAASHFAIGGVGVAGTMTPEELAMRQLRDGPEPETQLRKLLREATPAGQMYALFALRQLDSAEYATLSAPYRQNTSAVPTISGCIIHTQTMSEAVHWIDQYAASIRTWEKSKAAPKQT
jgi:hypothetical protein